MKLSMIAMLLLTLFACGTSIKDKEQVEMEMDAHIALNVINEYVANCNALKDPGKWVENHKLLSKEFKKDYKELIAEAYKNDPELGLGFDPIFNAQDYPEKGFEVSSVLPKERMVILRGIDMPDFILTTRLVETGNQWLLDGAGVVRIPKPKK